MRSTFAGARIDQADVASLPRTTMASRPPDPRPFLITFPYLLHNLPVLEKAAAGRGTLSSKGLYTAPKRAGGPFTVKASAGGISGTATVTVI